VGRRLEASSEETLPSPVLAGLERDRLTDVGTKEGLHGPIFRTHGHPVEHVKLFELLRYQRVASLRERKCQVWVSFHDAAEDETREWAQAIPADLDEHDHAGRWIRAEVRETTTAVGVHNDPELFA